MPTSPVDVIQKIVLELNQKVIGKVNIANYLKDLRKQTTSASKGMVNFHKSLRTMGQLSKNVATSLGAITGATVGAIGAFKKLMANQPFLELAIQARNANQAFVDLRQTYSELERANSALSLSLQDQSEALAQFAQRSLAAKLILPQVQDAIVKIREELVNNVGQRGVRAWEDFVQTLDPSEFARIMSNYKFASQDMFNAIAASSLDAANKFEVVRRIYSDIPDVADPIVQSTRRWESILSKVSALMGRLKQQFIDTFGPEIQKMLDYMLNDGMAVLTKSMQDLVKWLEKNREIIVSSFSAALKIVETLAKMFLQMPGWAKVGVAAFAFLPGIGRMVGALSVQFTQLAAQIASSFGPALLNPFVLALTAVGAVAAYQWSQVKKSATDALSAIEDQNRRILSIIEKQIQSAETVAEKTALSRVKTLRDELNKMEEVVAKETGRFDLLTLINPLTSDTGIGPREKELKWMKGRINQIRKQLSLAEQQVRSTREQHQEEKKRISTLSKWDRFLDQINKAQSPAESFQLVNEQLKILDAGASGITDKVESLSKIMETAGFNSKIFGQNVSDAMKAQSIELNNAIITLNKYAQVQEKQASKFAKQFFQSGQQEDRLAAQKFEAEAAKTRARIEELVNTRIKATNAELGIKRQLESQLTDIAKANLNISQQLYGTPALAVTAIKQVVDSLQSQKDLLQEQLNNIMEMRKIQPDNIALLKEERKLQLDIKQVTAEQLQQVKQLRDGYLDAVQAQAFGAGAFEKIIITQEKNLMRGLQARAVQQNYLLGQYGAAAGRHNKQAVRFGTSGALESLNGTAITRSQALQDLNNIADPLARSISESSFDMVQGLNASTQAIHEHASVMAKITAGVAAFGGGGVPAASSYMGEVIRQASGTTPSTPVKSSPRSGVSSTTKPSGTWHEKLKSFSRMLSELGLVLDEFLDDDDVVSGGPAGIGAGRVASTPGGS